MSIDSLMEKHRTSHRKEKRMARARNSFQRGAVEFKNEKWTIRYRVRSNDQSRGWVKKREVLPQCKNRKEALKALSKRMAEVNAQNNGSHQIESVPTFSEFASGLWVSYLSRKHAKPSTIYSYESMLKNHMLDEFGDKRLDRITSVDVTRFFNKVSDEVAPKYALNMYALLNVMFEVAYQYDLIESIPIRKKLHRPQHQSKKKPSLSGEQIRRIIENTPEDYRPLFLVAAITGLRLGEILALRWKNVDFDNRRLAITHNLWRGQLVSPKTEASLRTFSLIPELANVFRAQRQKSTFTQDDDFVFARLEGSPYDPDHLRNVVLYPALERAGIERSAREFGFHIFRHSAGSIVHAATRDLKLAQELLGHARISTTSDTYIHVSEEVAGEAVKILAREVNWPLIVPQESDQIQ